MRWVRRLFQAARPDATAAKAHTARRSTTAPADGERDDADVHGARPDAAQPRHRGPRRLRLVPEVVQTSTIDCGPACLTSLLSGFGIPAHYGRLREACHTGVDGTSIDELERVAGELGLDVEQTILPPDHLLLAEAGSLPAVVVMQKPLRRLHFVVLWSLHGRVVQMMDPAKGRMFTTVERLLGEVHVHRMTLPAETWRAWCQSEDFVTPLAVRLQRLGLPRVEREALIATACEDESGVRMAVLDAAVRMIATVVRAGGLRRGAEALRAVQTTSEAALADSTADTIPGRFWFARPLPDGDEIEVRGAVLVRVHGRQVAEESDATAAEQTAQPGAGAPAASNASLLRAAVVGHEPSPLQWIWQLIRCDGIRAMLVPLLLVLLAGMGVLIEAVLLRGFLELARDLGLVEQRITAGGMLLVFAFALLLVEARASQRLLALGRRLEIRFRIAFLAKLPLLGDRYFHSRPVSDMADRAHKIHAVRSLPQFVGQFLRATGELVFVAAGIAWLDPLSAPLVIAATITALAVPLAAQMLLTERSMQLFNHTGALSGFLLDSLLGHAAVRAHGGELAVRREHEELLVDWGRAGLRMHRALALFEGLQAALGFGLAIWLLARYHGRVGESGATLLLVYWALRIPALGQELGFVVTQLPILRNLTARLVEPLGARTDDGPGAAAPSRDAGTEARQVTRPEPSRATEPAGSAGTPGRDVRAPATPSGVAIRYRGVRVVASGHTLLEDIDLEIEPGTHVGVVGRSGAGKSTLVGLLLGWYAPASGAITVDGRPLVGSHLDELRRQTAWIDVEVQLWNRSLLENLLYGAADAAAMRIDDVLDDADLRTLVSKLPDGLQATLGESGGLLSGGEGQRVRLARALLRADARLAVLDEAFRGLERSQRQALLAAARRRWRTATMLCVTHDVSDTLDLDRVLVVENGAIAEDGPPRVLAARSDSRYRDLLDAEERARKELWLSDVWRRLWLTDGRLSDEEGA